IFPVRRRGEEICALTIRRPDLYLESAWDWGILKGCFGGSRIEPTDIDGLVERNGRFLVLEAKKPGVRIKQGQMLTFNALRNTGLFTIIVVWGENNVPYEMLVMYPPPIQPRRNRATLEDLRRVVKWWYDRVAGG
ncbi:hypothetical protein, partial [Desulfofundulus sp.]|uniref:hypothetical protein n=1 Tax=Desulfofundulus sp. TaxID=2282750 RepID=UPI003C78A53E